MVVGLIVFVMLLMTGCLHEDEQQRSCWSLDIPVVSISSNGTATTRGVCVSSEEDVRRVFNDETESIAIQFASECKMIDVFRLMGHFSMNGTRKFYFTSINARPIAVLYSMPGDFIDIADWNTKIDGYVMDDTKFYKHDGLTELFIGIPDWYEPESNPCDDVYEKSIKYMELSAGPTNRAAQIFCDASVSTARFSNFLDAASESGYKCVFLSVFDGFNFDAVQYSCHKARSYSLAMQILCDPRKSVVFDKIAKCDDYESLQIVSFAAAAAALNRTDKSDAAFDGQLQLIAVEAANRLAIIKPDKARDVISILQKEFLIDVHLSQSQFIPDSAK